MGPRFNMVWLVISLIPNQNVRVNSKCNKAIRDGRPRPRATRWVGTFPYILTPIPNLYDHSFPRYGQITFLTFRRPTTLTFDLKFWKYLSVTVYPYVICMPSFIMIGWEMAEILHIEILRKHGQTHTQTDRQTDRHGHYNTSPSPYGGRGKYVVRCVSYVPLVNRGVMGLSIICICDNICQILKNHWV